MAVQYINLWFLSETAMDAPTNTITIYRTPRCKLETSQRKTDRLRDVIDVWQDILAYVSDLYPSFSARTRADGFNNQACRLIREEFEEVFNDRRCYKHCAYEAPEKVSMAYDARYSNGHDGDRPTFDGTGEWFRTPGKYLTIEPNNRGYGLEMKLQPYSETEWYHLDVGEYQEDYLERVAEGDASLGASEIHLHDGHPYAHLTVKEDIEVYDHEHTSVDTYVGVDIGENVLYSVAAVDGAGVQQVEMESGREFRHHREEITAKQDRFQEQGKLGKVKAMRGQRRRYTEQVLRTAANEVVDVAVEQAPSVVVLEDLTDYRETARNPIHDFPFAAFQEYITDNAKERHVPVMTVDPRYTSQTCRQCGERNEAFRDGNEFYCRDCGYEVHADVNAAINIANRGRMET
jgi:IS605 OrfB family transposase